jgi:hypothetical protein
LGHAGGDPIRFAGFAVAAALASFLQIRLRGLATRLSVRFFVLLIGLTTLSWPEVAVIACVSAVVESLVWTSPRPAAMTTALYGAAAVLATSAAYTIYHVPNTASSPLLMVLAAIVYFVVNCLALMPDKPWKQSLFWTFPHYVAGGSAAGLLTIADRHMSGRVWSSPHFFEVLAYQLKAVGCGAPRDRRELSALHFAFWNRWREPSRPRSGTLSAQTQRVERCT